MVKGLPRSSHAEDCCGFIHHSKQMRGCKKINVTGDSLFHCFTLLWFESSALSAVTGGFNPEFYPLAPSSCRFGKAVLYGPNPSSSSGWMYIPKRTSHFRELRVCLWCCGEPSALPGVLFHFWSLFPWAQFAVGRFLADLGAGSEALLAGFPARWNKLLTQRTIWTEPLSSPTSRLLLCPVLHGHARTSEHLLFRLGLRAVLNLTYSTCIDPVWIFPPLEWP